MPGIIFSGGSSGVSPSFGSGGASSANWQVGPSPKEIFTTNHAAIPTSYNFILQTAQNSGITPAALTSATFTSGITHNIYKANDSVDGSSAGGLTIGSPVTFGLGGFGSGNFIILVNGNLNINSNIIVPPGSTVIFSASGNIMVAASVTEIDGFYSADGNFTVGSASNCTVGTADLSKLNVGGTVVANAARNGSTFINNRTFCNSGNLLYPSVTFTERPDFILNYPSLTRQIMRSWQDSPI
jgi:hypothetical protein